MTDVGHTRGPWRLGADLIRVHPDWRDDSGSSSKDCFHRNGYAKTIASIGSEDGDWRGIEQQVADARLITASPDLLEAGQRLIAVFDRQRMTVAERIVAGISDAGLRTEGNAAIEALRAAISRARNHGDQGRG